MFGQKNRARGGRLGPGNHGSSGNTRQLKVCSSGAARDGTPVDLLPSLDGPILIGDVPEVGQPSFPEYSLLIGFAPNRSLS